MNFKKLLLFICLVFGMGLGANAQIINSTQPETPIAPSLNNTGLAIAPNVDLHAAALADGAGTWRIYWVDGPTGTIVDADGGSGFDPDVAYYANADAVVLGYDNAGVVYVNDYYLTSLSPVNYNLNTATAVAAGNHVNIDMNSIGRGILCWENAGVVWACAFTIGTFSPGPPVPIAAGFMPDVIALDDGVTAAITYVDPSGNLMIETMDFNALGLGTFAPFGTWNFPAASGYRSPRIASQRNTASGFGNPDDFAVVSQDWTGSTYEVHAFFAPGGAVSAGPIVVNSAFLGCTTFDPNPVIAYNRNRVQIAWSQDYTGGCAPLWQTAPNFENDILMKSFSAGGFTSVMHEEVNQIQSNYAGISKTSLATEYDGNYIITNTNWNEGVLFQDPSTLYWKRRNAALPSYIEEQNIITEAEDRGDNFSLVTSPVDQTIEVQSESDAVATFQLLDNAGRVVELREITNDGNIYSIDINHLSGGMYFLNCSSEAGQEVLRVLQVRQ